MPASNKCLWVHWLLFWFSLLLLTPLGMLGSLNTLTSLSLCLSKVLPNVSEEKVWPTRAWNMKDFENVSEETRSSSSKKPCLLPPCSQTRRELFSENCCNARGKGGVDPCHVVGLSWPGPYMRGVYVFTQPVFHKGSARFWQVIGLFLVS